MVRRCFLKMLASSLFRYILYAYYTKLIVDEKKLFVLAE